MNRRDFLKGVLAAGAVPVVARGKGLLPEPESPPEWARKFEDGPIALFDGGALSDIIYDISPSEMQMLSAMQKTRA